MKVTINHVVICFITMFSFCLHKNSFGFDDVNTHPKITQTAINISKSTLNDYLIKNLGLTDGLDTKMPSNSENPIWLLLQQGSIAEDSPPCRASNHFHNPLKVWNESAMSDEPWWMNIKCSSWSPWYSNITWGTGFTSQYGLATARNNQTMGWDNARTYFYNALTSGSQPERETNFAKTFQAVGQVMEINLGGINI